MDDIAITPTNGSGLAGGLRRRHLALRAATVLAAVAASVVSLGLGSVPAMADDCPNEALRAENNSTQLPECRAYELVSPVFKEGFAPLIQGFADDRLAFAANGNYANNGYGGSAATGGNQYISVRSASGWITKAPGPSAPDYFPANPLSPVTLLALRLSSDLRSSLWLARRSDQPDTVSDIYVRGPDDAFTRIGAADGAALFGASDDLSDLVFHNGAGTYEYDGTGAGQPRPVNVDNSGQPVGCGTHEVGVPEGSNYHGISTDGRVIFWTSECAGALYARVNGTTTIKASASQCTRESSDPGGACNAESAALFVGANASGTRVYFTTEQQLVNTDTDSTTDLYECDIPPGTPPPVGSVNPCPDLHEVSATAGGSGFQGVTRISDDGSRVYFVATGVLAPNPGANSAAAVAGDDNLYVWQRDPANPGGETRFVAKLDPADASLVWGGEEAFGRMAQATDDGRYLVFATYAALIDHGPQADTDTARDIYRYDAETGALTRLSTGADGEGGNEPRYDAQFTPIAYGEKIPSTHGPRTAMTDDGQSVVFTTADALVPSDTNGTIDAYLWHDGRISLISSGKPSADGGVSATASDPFGVTIGGIQVFITPSGRDVYFTTFAQLTPNDVDTQLDIYDARIDGGFDVVPPAGCAGDACQGGRSIPPPAPSPDSSSATAQGSAPQVTPSFSVKSLTASQMRRVASTGKVTLSVTTNAPGTLSAEATATIAKRPSSVGSAKRRVTKAGTVSLSLTLSKRARAELEATRKLTGKVLVSQDNVAIARTVSLKLTLPNAAKKKFKKKSSRTTRPQAATKGGRS
jgi:hypothetical protein